ncbi:MAG: hypothetical protein ACTHNW_13365, partial [Mucilaginibacter sp.]
NEIIEKICLNFNLSLEDFFYEMTNLSLIEFKYLLENYFIYIFLKIKYTCSFQEILQNYLIEKRKCFLIKFFYLELKKIMSDKIISVNKLLKKIF